MYHIPTRHASVLIAQTALIDPEAGDPSSLAQRLTGDDTKGIAGAVAHYPTTHGWTVETEHITTGANGYTTTDGSKKIAIHDELAPAQVAKTMIHEAAHAPPTSSCETPKPKPRPS